MNLYITITIAKVKTYLITPNTNEDHAHDKYKQLTPKDYNNNCYRA